MNGYRIKCNDSELDANAIAAAMDARDEEITKNRGIPEITKIKIDSEKDKTIVEMVDYDHDLKQKKKIKIEIKEEPTPSLQQAIRQLIPLLSKACGFDCQGFVITGLSFNDGLVISATKHLGIRAKDSTLLKTLNIDSPRLLGLELVDLDYINLVHKVISEIRKFVNGEREQVQLKIVGGSRGDDE